MSQYDFHSLLTGIAALSPERLEALRREVDSKLAATPGSTKPPSEADFKRQLLKSSLMTSVPTPAAPGSRPTFEPVAITGEPLSETIIRERR